MRTLAIIPARGGSKRIPGKNLAMVGRETLLARALTSATACDVTVVSTDDPGVREEAERWCWPDYPSMPTLHARQPEHATDDAQLEPVIADVLAQVERIPEAPFDAIVLLQPTSPFRTAAHVAQALAILQWTGCDSVVSVTRNSRTHPSRHGCVWDGAHYAPAGEPTFRPSSQSCEAYVEENGAVYAFTRAHWGRTGSRMGGDTRALVMHWSEAVDIDEPEDLDAARRLAR